MQAETKKLKLAFVVGQFPTISETFIINQVADLADRGIEVEIFSFKKGVSENISQRFYDYKMKEKTHYLDMPDNVFLRFFLAIPKIFKLLLYRPGALIQALDFKKYGRNAFSLKLIYWCEPFLGKKFDLVHCHFGTMANKFLVVREILGIQEKFITSFYGYDVSMIFKNKPANYYDKLKKECSLYFVMSENMKERVAAGGFAREKIMVLPISIDVDKYPFGERTLKEEERAQIVSVGRFVEKKGFDDLLRALAIVKEKTDKPFECNIIGGGPLEKELRALTDELNLNDLVDYKGYMKIEDIINYFQNMHLYLQPSKTASDGDME